jgi:hypothetical protein
MPNQDEGPNARSFMPGHHLLQSSEGALAKGELALLLESLDEARERIRSG